MPLYCILQKNIPLGEFPDIFCIFDVISQVGVGVDISLGFDSFSILAQVLKSFLYFFRILGGWVEVSTPCGAVSSRGGSVFVPLLSEL